MLRIKLGLDSGHSCIALCIESELIMLSSLAAQAWIKGTASGFDMAHVSKIVATCTRLRKFSLQNFPLPSKCFYSYSKPFTLLALFKSRIGELHTVAIHLNFLGGI